VIHLAFADHITSEQRAALRRALRLSLRTAL
jgi:hypothetical protein